MALTWEKFVEKLCTEAQSDALYHHPIGSIYQSLDSTSPATLFGGTWAALGGRMLIGVDGTYTAGSTGGEATHTLTTGEIPSHSHVETMYFNDLGGTRALGIPPNSSGQAKTMAVTSTGSSPLEDSTVVSTGAAGGDGAHNNLPPYLSVYMWKRTA